MMMLLTLENDLSNGKFYVDFIKYLTALTPTRDSIELLLDNDGVIKKGEYIGFFSFPDKAVVLKELSWKSFNEYIENYKIESDEQYSRLISAIDEKFIGSIKIESSIELNEFLTLLERFEKYEYCATLLKAYNNEQQ
jgi:hypothetical protein